LWCGFVVFVWDFRGFAGEMRDFSVFVWILGFFGGF